MKSCCGGRSSGRIFRGFQRRMLGGLSRRFAHSLMIPGHRDQRSCRARNDTGFGKATTGLCIRSRTTNAVFGLSRWVIAWTFTDEGSAGKRNRGIPTDNVLTPVAAGSDEIWNSGNCDARRSRHGDFGLQQARHRPRKFVSCPRIPGRKLAEVKL